MNPSISNEVFVKGYYSAGDLGGGEFYFDTSSSSAPNNGTIFQSFYTSTGRWFRLLNGTRVNAKWFGAYGNGSNNDTLALQTALDFCGSSGLGLYISKGTYIVSSSSSSTFCLLVKYSNSYIEGDGHESEIKGANNSANVGLMILQANSGQLQNVIIKNLNFNGNKVNQSGNWTQKCITVYCLTTTSTESLNITLDGLFCHDAYSYTSDIEAGGISVLGDDFNYTLQNIPTQNIIICNCYCWNNVGWGIGTNFSNGIIINNNICWQNDTQGITLWNTQDSIVTSNRCYANGSIGINLEISDRITISNNSLASTQYACIRIFNSLDIIINANECELNASYYLYFAIGVISGNGYNSGLYKTRPSQKVIISNNNIRSIGTNGYAISILADSGFSNCNNISINDNTISNLVTGKSVSAITDNLILVNNKIFGCIYTSSSSGFITIDSNDLTYDNSPTSFNLFTVGSAQNLVIKGNLFRCNQNGNSAIALTQYYSKSIVFDCIRQGAITNFIVLSGGAISPIQRDNLSW